MLGSDALQRLVSRSARRTATHLLVSRRPGSRPHHLGPARRDLDSETVYNLLPGVIKRAKRPRQVVMVNHNANLAVTCDDERVIVCCMERDGSNKISYEAGAIEELNLTRSVVTIVERTKPAFENRLASAIEARNDGRLRQILQYTGGSVSRGQHSWQKPAAECKTTHYIARRSALFLKKNLVERRRIELPTFALRTRRSPS